MMERHILLGLALLVLIPTLLCAQENWLKGKVVSVGEHGQEVPEVNITVTIEEVGNSGNTTSQGVFRIALPQVFRPGDRVTLGVDKPEWRIHYPWSGEARIPGDLTKELVQVRLAPLGVPVFLCPPSLEKFIRDMMEHSKQEITPQGKIEELNVGHYIKEWAMKYGFSVQQVKDELDKWVDEVEKNRGDLYESGLAAFAKKEFANASKLFLESAEYKGKRLEEVKRKERDLIKEVVRDLRLAGDSDIRNRRPADALQSYQRALAFVSKEDMPQLWAATWRDIGKANNAVEAYQRALEVRTREHLPGPWAETHQKLAEAYAALDDWPNVATSYANVLQVYPAWQEQAGMGR